MKPENHITAFEEHKKNIFIWALEINGLEKSQRTIGLNASRGIVELLLLYLEEKNKISPGFQLNHRWFKSDSIFQRLPEFPKKKQIVSEMVKLENISEALSYGSPKPIEEIRKAVELFKEIENEINKLRGVEIE
ncbi:MAG: hypothetical protein HY831_05490 [Candidatus Aenigmarchaeota archaeon]|nr:hypothetical protein [Candidatus Aenigmarchaeota archaeon]